MNQRLPLFSGRQRKTLLKYAPHSFGKKRGGEKVKMENPKRYSDMRRRIMLGRGQRKHKNGEEWETSRRRSGSRRGSDGRRPYHVGRSALLRQAVSGAEDQF